MSRLPDYKVAALNKHTDAKNGNVGAAWKNEDGSISVQLDAFVTLSNQDGGLVLTLFPSSRAGAQYKKPRHQILPDHDPLGNPA